MEHLCELLRCVYEKSDMDELSSRFASHSEQAVMERMAQGMDETTLQADEASGAEWMCVLCLWGVRGVSEACVQGVKDSALRATLQPFVRCGSLRCDS